MPGIEQKNNWVSSATLLSLKQNLTGTTLIIAPHPDDESLGCGGTIALLKKAGRKVHILFVSDGSMSHPGSIKYNAASVAHLREMEALNAAKMLGIPETDCTFMRLKDGAVPAFGEMGFKEAVSKTSYLLKKISPGQILLPWKNDPHRDHQACWQIVNAAVRQAGLVIKLFHYLIWFWQRGTMDYQLKDNVQWYKTDISSVAALKKCAIAQHVSQVTRLIDDDENGFILSDEMLSHFDDNFELFAVLKN